VSGKGQTPLLQKSSLFTSLLLYSFATIHVTVFKSWTNSLYVLRHISFHNDFSKIYLDWNMYIFLQ